MGSLDLARATYEATRCLWFSRGPLDAYDRLALATVAAGLRRLAFFPHLPPDARKRLPGLLLDLGFSTRTLHARYDLGLAVRSLSRSLVSTYTDYRRQHDRYVGLAVAVDGSVWRDQQGRFTLTSIGRVLGYPACCVEMDLRTKRADDALFLRALVCEVGNDPSTLLEALKRRVAVERNEMPAHHWRRRATLTLRRFPYALHAACNSCLESPNGPTALLSRDYEQLAGAVSPELHYLVRWASYLLGS